MVSVLDGYSLLLKNRIGYQVPLIIMYPSTNEEIGIEISYGVSLQSFSDYNPQLIFINS